MGWNVRDTSTPKSNIFKIGIQFNCKCLFGWDPWRGQRDSSHLPIRPSSLYFNPQYPGYQKPFTGPLPVAHDHKDWQCLQLPNYRPKSSPIVAIQFAAEGTMVKICLRQAAMSRPATDCMNGFCLSIALAQWLEIFLNLHLHAVMLFTDKHPPIQATKSRYTKFIIWKYRNHFEKIYTVMQHFKCCIMEITIDQLGPTAAEKHHWLMQNVVGRLKASWLQRTMEASTIKSKLCQLWCLYQSKRRSNEHWSCKWLVHWRPNQGQAQVCIDHSYSTAMAKGTHCSHIGFYFSANQHNNLVQNLGLLYYLLAPLSTMKVAAIQAAHKTISIDNKPNQPIDWVSIICYCVWDQLDINKVVAIDNDNNSAAVPQYADNMTLPLAPRWGNEI